MVQAILDGRKTMTRRVVKGYTGDRPPRTTNVPFEDWHGKEIRCPYGKPGDILWVRENWQLTGWSFEDGDMTVKFQTGEMFDCQCHDPTEDSMWLLNQVERLENGGYLVMDPNDDERFVFTDKKQPFKPSIHMPKDACRIWLKVTNVRVERLHDMDGATADECDSLKEGIIKFHHGDGNYGYHWKGDMDGKNFVHPFDAFVDLWKLINGPESWAANPWVWVVEFKVLSTTGRPEQL